MEPEVTPEGLDECLAQLHRREFYFDPHHIARIIKELQRAWKELERLGQPPLWKEGSSSEADSYQ